MTITSSLLAHTRVDASRGPAGNDRLFGTPGNDAIFGGTGRDEIFGGAGDDVLVGEDGRDRLFGQAGNDRLLGGTGSDVLVGGTGVDRMQGQDGDDTYVVDTAGDIVNEAANMGQDRVFSFVSYTLPDNVENLQLSGTRPIDGVGNALDNVISGNPTGMNVPNRISGGAGDDRLFGGSGADTLIGGQGNDLLVGGGDADITAGGPGNDAYVVNNDRDRVIERVNEGIDTVYSSFTETLQANVENLILNGTFNAAGFGNSLGNVITGNVGRNYLDGAGGNDVLLGEAGRDVLVGGLGKDDLRGGTGGDTFVFRSVAESPAGRGRDLIRDFVHGQDKINLVAVDANTTAVGDQTFTFIGADDFSGTAGELRYERSVLRGDVDGDGIADLQVTIGNGVPLAADDFFL